MNLNELFKDESVKALAEKLKDDKDFTKEVLAMGENLEDRKLKFLMGLIHEEDN